MKRTLGIVIGLLLVAGALLFLFRDPLRQLLYDRLTRDMFVSGDRDDFDPGPVTGSSFPGLRAEYQGREVTLLQPFAGSRGVAFIALRSVDWCPYCMRQLIQLQSLKPQFDAAGIALVAMTYDDPTLQRQFIDRHGITIPLLSDIDALSFRTLGILNPAYAPGDFQYGIPYPGMIVVDPQGTVVGKQFLEAYSSRVDATAALAFARAALGID